MCVRNMQDTFSTIFWVCENLRHFLSAQITDFYYTLYAEILAVFILATWVAFHYNTYVINWN